VLAWLRQLEQAVESCNSEHMAGRKVKGLRNIHQQVFAKVTINFLGFVKDFQKGAFLEAVFFHHFFQHATARLSR
jgi:hypothetical protein